MMCVLRAALLLASHPCVDRRRCAAAGWQGAIHILCAALYPCARQGVEGGNEKRLALGDASAIMPHAMVRGFSPWAPMQRASQVYFSLALYIICRAHALHTCVRECG
jgi:hypothetical protein